MAGCFCSRCLTARLSRSRQPTAKRINCVTSGECNAKGTSMKLEPMAWWVLTAALICHRATAADAPPVALVNVDRILKDFKPLNDKLDPLKAEAKDFEGALQVRQAELETVGNQLRQVQPGSPDHQRLQI